MSYEAGTTAHAHHDGRYTTHGQPQAHAHSGGGPGHDSHAGHRGGPQWQPVATDAPVTAVAFDPNDPARMLAYAAPPGDGLRESGDGGQSWTTTGWELDSPDDAVAHLAVRPEDPDVVFAGTFGRDVYRSDDGGRTWTPLAREGVPEHD